jgi:hypothetical protein
VNKKKQKDFDSSSARARRMHGLIKKSLFASFSSEKEVLASA